MPRRLSDFDVVISHLSLPIQFPYRWPASGQLWQLVALLASIVAARWLTKASAAGKVQARMVNGSDPQGVADGRGLACVRSTYFFDL